MKPKDKSGAREKNEEKKLTPHDPNAPRPLPKKPTERNPSGGKDTPPEDQISGQFQKWGL